MSQRMDQVNANLHQIIAEVFAREVELPQDHLATITKVETSPDLKQAKVYISILPFDSAEEVFPLLQRKRNDIQQEVHQKLTMKYSPVLEFVLDAKPEATSEIERLIDEEMNLFDV